MEDPDYAEKYDEGASKTDVPGKVKQAADARFLEGTSGTFFSGGAIVRPDRDSGMVMFDVGKESYLQSYLTGRASWMGAINSVDWYTGLDTGLRVQTPTRLAPFVGVGAFLGASREEVDASDDNVDNDDDGFTDEWGETDDEFTGGLASVYPETGAHFWWTPRMRLTAYGRYMITSQGREHDDWLIGGGIAFFSK